MFLCRREIISPMDKAAKKTSQTGSYANRWVKLLSSVRIGDCEFVGCDGDSGVEIREDRSDFERDYERVIFSPSFRRLAGKTQVRTFPDVDFIHNRLTHSIEVSAISRSLGVAVSKFLEDRHDINGADSKRISDSIAWITQAAGVAHDLGNPPYGHAGEFAIQHWCRTLDNKRKIHKNDLVWKDFLYYDGNAQSFRMLCSSQTRSVNALCFTAASAGALVKYPKMVTELKETDKSYKFDVFSNDAGLFKKIWSCLGLSWRRHQRHPLSYLSEAADDICYRVLDFEDAVVSGVISRQEVIDVFRNGLSLPKETSDNKVPLSRLRGKLIRMLVTDFVKVFVNNYDAIMEGKLKDDLRANLPVDSKSKLFLDEIGKKYDLLYTERSKVVRECAAYSQIPIVLNRGYDCIREMFVARTRQKILPNFENISHSSQQFITLAWGEDYYNRHRNRDFAWWMHMLLDYVVGMTDAYIDMLSKKLI